MNRFVFKIVLGLSTAVAVSCNRDQTNSFDSSPPTVGATTSDAESIERIDGRPIETLASVRRDGRGNIVELDLRDSDAAVVSSVLAVAGQMLKLRSVLLNDASLTVSDGEAIADITTLENLDLRGCRIDDTVIKPLQRLSRLKAIRLSGRDGDTQVSDAGLQTLGRLPALQVLAIDFLPITDGGLRAVAESKRLRELYAARTRLTDSGAETLAALPELSKLRLAGTDFGSQGMKTLVAGGTALTELDVSDCEAIDDSALASIGRLKSLEKLNLYHTAVTTGQWSELGDLPTLHWLNVDKTGVDDQALQAIGKLKGLTFLHLGSTRISDDGLKHLRGLDALEKLIVTRTAVTPAGVDQLQAQLPTTEIQLRYEPGNQASDTPPQVK